MGPRLLIIETSGRAGSVAVAEGPALCRSRRLDETRRHARDLAPAVATLLAEQGWRARDLAAVLVSRGPGSYTGLRVGIMSAKAFAYATRCALIAVDTFAAIAAQAPVEAGEVDVLSDAQQDRIYVQRYSCAGVARSPLAIQSFDEWLAARAPTGWVSGPALVKFRDRLPGNVQVVPADAWDPRPESILRLGLARFDAGQRDDLHSLEPLYLRPSSAEEKWTALGK